MGPVYPVFDKEEPPADKPGKGGQEEELEHEQGQEEREQHQEEKYLEEACQEVQRERNVAKTRDLSEACQEYRREIQAARRKLEIRTAGKPGIIRLPEIPTFPLQGCHPTIPHPCKDLDYMGNHENITDDESDSGPSQTSMLQSSMQTSTNQYVQFHAVQTNSVYLAGGKNKHLHNDVKPPAKD